MEQQEMKTENKQREFNGWAKPHEDTMFKFMSYCGMLEKLKREDLKNSLNNMEVVLGVQNFEHYYK